MEDIIILFVIIDDFSRFTWVLMIKHSKHWLVFVKIVQNEKGFLITKIRSGHRLEFDSVAYEKFGEDNGFLMTSPLQGLLIKTVWLKEKILRYKNLLDQC